MRYGPKIWIFAVMVTAAVVLLLPAPQALSVSSPIQWYDYNEGMKAGKAEILLEDDSRTAKAFRFELTMPDDSVIHVRTGRKYGMVKLWDRAENDLENRLDCYEPFFDFEVEETGERGYGVAEYDIQPPWPRWLV